MKNRFALGVLGCGLALLAASPCWAQARLEKLTEAEAAEIALGERLFGDGNFTNPGMDFQTSCKTCHVPGDSPRGPRAFADALERSVLPARRQDGERYTLRNAPTLLGAGSAPRFGWAGEFATLEALIESKVTGPMFGWAEERQEQARDEIQHFIINDQGGEGGTYKERFTAAQGIDITEASRDEVVAAAVKALAASVRSLKFANSSAYDAFVGMNRMNVGPAKNESVFQFAGRLLSRYEAMEVRAIYKVPDGFTEPSIDGFLMFYTMPDMEGGRRIGNCAACHTPQPFTDYKFHNIGVSQFAYDKVHGEGSFAKLDIPKAPPKGEAAGKFQSVPSKDRPGEVDLGFWNYATGDSPLKGEGESDDAFRARMLGALRTPTLRNLERTGPYLHDGSAATLEEAILVHVRAAELARAGKLRNADEELKNMTITEDDVPALVDFLKTMNEVPREDGSFRRLLLTAKHPEWAMQLGDPWSDDEEE